MFRYRVIGVWKSAAPNLYALPSRELLFSSCPHWHQFVVPVAPDQSFIVRHCVKFSVPWVPSNSPWKGFPHNFYALIWATCSRRNLRKWLRGAPGHCSSLCNRFRGFSRRSHFLKLWGHQWVGCENLRMHGSQLLLWAASQFFFQSVDL